MENFCGVILAGGKGSRLMPLTANIPKPMISITNKPMIHYAIDLLRYAGIKKIIIVVRHLGEKIIKYIENIDWGIDWGMEIRIPNVDSLDTADALRKVSNLIDCKYIIVSMADIITNINVKGFIDFSLKKDAFGTISLLSSDQPKQFGVIVLDSEHRIHGFLEKPGYNELYISSLVTKDSSLHQHTNLINTGLYFFKNGILDILDEIHLMDFGKDVFPFLLEKNYPIYGYLKKYYWLDAGNPTTYKFTNWDLLRKWAWPIAPVGEETEPYKWFENIATIEFGKGIHIDAHVAIGQNSKLKRNAVIETLSSIGRNVEIGEGTHIRESIIWDNVKIGNNCNIKNSIICNNVEIGSDVTIIESSIVPSNCKVNDKVKLEHRVLNPNETI
ncbi:MAG: sugar phosphate nucleotidyltransferase [Candidatus Helarchaeota archaeon]